MYSMHSFNFKVLCILKDSILIGLMWVQGLKHCYFACVRVAWQIQYSALPHAKFATQLSPQAVYFIQTGSSALSNTYALISAHIQGQLRQSGWYDLGRTTFWIYNIVTSYKSLWNYQLITFQKAWTTFP